MISSLAELYIRAGTRAALAGGRLRTPQRRPDDIHDAVEAVLSREEYRAAPKSLVQRIREGIAELIEQALEAFVGGGRGALLAWLILGLAATTLAVVAVRFAGGVTRDAYQPLAAAPSRRRSAAEWRAEAEEAERAGRWRLALRARYRALVADLAEHGLVEDVAGRTSGEYRVEVATNVPKVAAPFSGATEIFERAWYGRLDTDAEDAARLRELADEVMAGTGR